MHVLCVFSQYNYGLCSRGEGYEYTNFLPALKRLGHEVTFFETWNRNKYLDFVGLNRDFLDTVRQVQPDIILAVQTHYEIWLETWQLIRDLAVSATINWATDDSWKYFQFSRFLVPVLHAFATTYPETYDQYLRGGHNSVLLTQWAANAETLCEPLPAKSCRYKVTFIGSAHGDRIKRISKLRSLGIDVKCFGYGWPSGPIAAETIPEIIRDSVISLNFANSRGVNQIKARNFEVPGAGGFLLTESAPDIEKYYLPNQEVVTFSGLSDLSEKVKYFLSHPNARDSIAFAGFQRTRKDHTYDQRMKDVLEFALTARERWVKTGVKEAKHSFEELSRKHRVNLGLKMLRQFLVLPCNMIWGKKRGPRAARRLLFEVSWRLVGARTYRSAGWPGRIFYNES